MDYCLIRSLSCTLFSKQFCKFGNKIIQRFHLLTQGALKYAQICNCRYLSNEICIINRAGDIFVMYTCTKLNFSRLVFPVNQYFQLVRMCCVRRRLQNTLKYFFQVCQFALLTFKTQSTISSRNMSQILEHCKHIVCGNNWKSKLI